MTLRDVLPRCEPDQVLVLEPPEETNHTVFYFPGCGSERLHSTISMAALHVLGELGVRTVIPPPFLCCGYPAHFNAKTSQYSRTVLRDTILFSQIREMFSYLSFDACLVTCGTCREGLDAMEAGKLFGGRILDVARYAVERGLRLEGDGEWLYHAPCHDSLEGQALDVIGKLGGFGKVVPVPHCCSEAGTLSLSRPDITDSMLHKKRGALGEALRDHPAGARILTNCPSCVQGLGRNIPMGVDPRHLAVALAEKISGPGWLEPSASRRPGRGRSSSRAPPRSAAGEDERHLVVERIALELGEDHEPRRALQALAHLGGVERLVVEGRVGDGAVGVDGDPERHPAAVELHVGATGGRDAGAEGLPVGADHLVHHVLGQRRGRVRKLRVAGIGARLGRRRGRCRGRCCGR